MSVPLKFKETRRIEIASKVGPITVVYCSLFDEAGDSVASGSYAMSEMQKSHANFDVEATHRAMCEHDLRLRVENSGA